VNVESLGRDEAGGQSHAEGRLQQRYFNVLNLTFMIRSIKIVDAICQHFTASLETYIRIAIYVLQAYNISAIVCSKK
jgi:hypothetical protein